MKRYFAVLDTNVIVSAVLSSTKRESVPVRILESALYGRITPLYNSAIFSEYEEVLKKRSFNSLNKPFPHCSGLFWNTANL